MRELSEFKSLRMACRSTSKGRKKKPSDCLHLTLINVFKQLERPMDVIGKTDGIFMQQRCKGMAYSGLHN